MMADVRPIDANELLECFRMAKKHFEEQGDVSCMLGAGYVIAILETDGVMPSIDYAPVRHGEWIHCAGKSNLWYCSECGGKILYNPTRRTYNIKKLPVDEMNRFCRSCGAKMDGGKTDGEI